MNDASKLTFLLLVAALGGCGADVPAAPRTPAAPAPSSAVTVARAAPTAAVPATPRPSVEVVLTQFHRFVTLSLARLRPRRIDDAALSALLPSALRPRFEGEVAAPQDLRKIASAVYETRAAWLECLDRKCPQAEARERAQERARDRLTSAADRASKRHEGAISAFERALASSPSAAVAIGLARLHEIARELDDIATENNPAEIGFDYGDLPPDNASYASTEAIEAYARAKALAPATDLLGFHARYGIAVHRTMMGDAAAARVELRALAPAAPDAFRVEVLFRLGVVEGAGPDADHAKAAAAFRAALVGAGRSPTGTAPPTPDVVTREDLGRALLVAEYRAGHFAEALTAALADLDAPAAPAGKKIAIDFSRRGSLSPDGAARLAADCVERLGPAADLGAATPETFADVMGHLALRRFFRGDADGALSAAEAAIAKAPDAGESSDAYDVLIAIASRAGEGSRVAELTARKAKVARRSVQAGGFGLLGLLRPGSTVEDEERGFLAGKPPQNAPGSPQQRSVASLVRLCLEPTFWRIPPPRRRGKSKLDAERVVEITARAFDQRPVQVEAAVSGPPVEGLVECLRTVGPTVLIGAPNSLSARVELGTASEPEWLAKSGLGAFGADEDAAFGGIGGLIGKGAGSGSGSGVGGGRGAGIGGLGGLGSKPPAKKPPPKRPTTSGASPK